MPWFMMLLSSVSSRFSGLYFAEIIVEESVTITCAFIVHSMILSLSLKYPGFDPESSANATTGMGIDMGGYPASKKVVLGFNIDLL